MRTNLRQRNQLESRLRNLRLILKDLGQFGYPEEYYQKKLGDLIGEAYRCSSDLRKLAEDNPQTRIEGMEDAGDSICATAEKRGSTFDLEIKGRSRKRASKSSRK